MSIQTPLTKMFNIKNPIMLAGMSMAAGPDLAAAVTNAGGLGCIGGVGYTPKQLRGLIHELKEGLNDKSAPFAVDLLLPQVGSGARATNYDYTKGLLDELIDIIIEEKAALFVCAVGVPAPRVVKKLHDAGIPYMGMCGAVKHAVKAISVGADMICGQGGEGGGHTGSTPTSLLIPELVDLCKNHKSPLTGQPVQVIAAGGIYRGSSLAAMLNYGATGVWIGSAFLLAEEAGASGAHQQAVIKAGLDDTVRTIIYTGRPLRVLKTPFIMDWEENKQAKIKELTSQGTIPVGMDCEPEHRPFLMGQTVGSSRLNAVRPAKQIIDEIMVEAIDALEASHKLLAKL